MSEILKTTKNACVYGGYHIYTKQLKRNLKKFKHKLKICVNKLNEKTSIHLSHQFQIYTVTMPPGLQYNNQSLTLYF